MTPERFEEITERQTHAAELVAQYQLSPCQWGPLENNMACYAQDVGELLAALGGERERCAKVAESFYGDHGRDIARMIRV